MIFYTADEHYYHKNIIKYCNRPFNDMNEMVNELVDRHNKVVSDNDTVIHVGDFSFASKPVTENLINKLNGKHVFLLGDHDSSIKRIYKDIGYLDKRNINGIYVIACHWAFRVWPKSHYGSINVHGHSHGQLKPVIANQYDVGVDNNNFYPVSFYRIKELLNI